MTRNLLPVQSVPVQRVPLSTAALSHGNKVVASDYRWHCLRTPPGRQAYWRWYYGYNGKPTVNAQCTYYGSSPEPGQPVRPALHCTGGKQPNATQTHCVCPAGKQDVGGVCLTPGRGHAHGGSAVLSPHYDGSTWHWTAYNRYTGSPMRWHGYW